MRPNLHALIRRSLSPALLALTASLTNPPALAQDQAPPPADPKLQAASPVQLLEDFNFYVNIANTELAKANAQALLEKTADPRKFLALVEDSATMQQRFDESYRRAILNKDLEPYAAQLWLLYEEGRRMRARDPKEIDANIAMLTGNSRARLLASARLKEAREHAVPQLLAAMTESKDAVLRAESASLLREFGRDAVMPLCAALRDSSPAAQEAICRVLGGIQYPAALPFLYELRVSAPAPVRDAADGAIARIAGRIDSERPPSDFYRELAERYLASPASLTIFPGESHQLAWSFVKGVGVNPTAIRSEVFHQTMAMAMAEKALALDPANSEALALWLGANFARQLSTPDGYENPLYPTTAEAAGTSGSPRRDPMYYAVAAGSGPVQRVLARALAMQDTRLARKAIEALDMNMASASVASEAIGGGRPLVEALSYPDRRVQLEAATAIAKAAPTTGFEGAERVVPTLAAAIRDAGSLFAAVIAREPEQQQHIRAALESDAYTVIRPAFDLAQAMDSINESPGVDLMVIQLPAEPAASIIEQARRHPRLRATPILAMMSLAEANRVASRFSADPLTKFARDGLDNAQVTNAARQLTESASGPRVTAEQARTYSLASLDRLTDLAVAANPILDVADATTPLVAALANSPDDIRLRIADVLARIRRPEAQVPLFDAALAASGAQRVALLNAAASSARRFGNMLEERQLKRLVELVQTGQDAEATAAAALMGALNLENTRLVPLITGR